MRRLHYRLAAAAVCVGTLVLLRHILPPDARTAGEVVVVRDRNDAWPLAYRLGEAVSGQVVYARLWPGHVGCYLLNATRGQRIRVRLSTPVGGQDLRLALIGPGLPAGNAPAGLTRPPGEGVQWAAPIHQDRRALRDPARPQRWQARQQLLVRAPARARYVLVVTGNSGRQDLYRLEIAGERRARLAAIPQWLLQAFAAEYFADPKEALTRLAGIAALIAILLALWLLGNPDAAPPPGAAATGA